MAEVDDNARVRMWDLSTGSNSLKVTVLVAVDKLRVFHLTWEPLDNHHRTWHVAVEETLDGVTIRGYDVVFRAAPLGLQTGNGRIRLENLAFNAFSKAFRAGHFPPVVM